MQNQNVEANQQTNTDELTKPRTIMVSKTYTVFKIALTEDIEYPSFNTELRSDKLLISDGFGSTTYAKEELTAE